jgi:glycerophosphoryl diester phosphodiesterase
MVLVIGHRGAAGYEPENTIRSFGRAMEMGVDMIELDVHLTRDEELVVIHDDTVDRTTDGRGYVRDMDIEEIRLLDAGRGERIPTLDEVFRLVWGKCAINIELKGLGTAQPVLDFLDELIASREGRTDQILISSFNPDMLIEARDRTRKYALGVLVKDEPYGAEEFGKEIGAFSVNPEHRYLAVDFVKGSHETDLKVFPWTVNDPGDISRMKDLGVDGIITDYPDRI